MGRNTLRRHCFAPAAGPDLSGSRRRHGLLHRQAGRRRVHPLSGESSRTGISNVPGRHGQRSAGIRRPAQPDYELILSRGLRSGGGSTMIYHSPAVLEQLEHWRHPVLVETSSYEVQPMGRMEWIKLYAALLDRRTRPRRCLMRRWTAWRTYWSSSPPARLRGVFPSPATRALLRRPRPRTMWRSALPSQAETIYSFDESLEDNASPPSTFRWNPSTVQWTPMC